jgi:hypothetical protein
MLVSSASWSYEDGAPAGHTGGFGEPDCSACHSVSGDARSAGRLEIEGLPERYAPGELYELAIVLEHPDLKSGGFQLALRTENGEPAGQVRAVSPRTRVIGSGTGQRYLQHSREGLATDTDGRMRWEFRWRAPETGEPVVLNLAANAANDDLSALGDYILTLEKKLEARTRGSGPAAAAFNGSSRNR